jgi:HEAT repeat protein
MSCARVLLTVAPLPVTFWGLVAATVVVAVLLTMLMVRHAGSARADRIRERVRGQLGPVFSRFLETDDPVHLADELRPAFMRMDAAERPVAAVFITEVMREATPSQAEKLRSALERAGIVALGERGTRRFSPWRRALACELLGKIGVRSSVPALLERLGDRRPEVRMAAVRALGDIGSAKAVPVLGAAFLERSWAPTAVVSDALRRIGGEAASVFERGVGSPNPTVRVSSCFGLAALASEAADAPRTLAQALVSDSDARVRSASAGALGIVGGEDAPATLVGATGDAEVHVRRAAVKALGSFDDPATVETLAGCIEDDDRETAIRAAEALFALTRGPRAAPEARARIESSSAWAVEYARRVAEVTEAAEVSA